MHDKTIIIALLFHFDIKDAALMNLRKLVGTAVLTSTMAEKQFYTARTKRTFVEKRVEFDFLAQKWIHLR